MFKFIRQLPFFACVLLLGCAEAPETEPGLVPQATLQALIARGSADSLATAALLLEPADKQRALELMIRSTAIEPLRPDLLWLHVQLCAETAACDPAPMQLRLRSADPDNAIGWLGELARTLESSGDEQIDRLLMQIGSARRFDLYWNPLQARLLAEIGLTDTLPLSHAIPLVISRLAGVDIPKYAEVLNACKTTQLSRQPRLDACRLIAILMRRGDTYITEQLGTAIAKRAWPEGSVEHSDAAETQRVNRYRMTIVTQLSSSWNNSTAGDYLRLLSRHQREQDLVVSRILAANRSADPPLGAD